MDEKLNKSMPYNQSAQSSHKTPLTDSKLQVKAKPVKISELLGRTKLKCTKKGSVRKIALPERILLQDRMTSVCLKQLDQDEPRQLTLRAVLDDKKLQIKTQPQRISKLCRRISKSAEEVSIRKIALPERLPLQDRMHEEQKVKKPARRVLNFSEKTEVQTCGDSIANAEPTSGTRNITLQGTKSVSSAGYIKLSELQKTNKARRMSRLPVPNSVSEICTDTTTKISKKSRNGKESNNIAKTPIDEENCSTRTSMVNSNDEFNGTRIHSAEKDEKIIDDEEDLLFLESTLVKVLARVRKMIRTKGTPCPVCGCKSEPPRDSNHTEKAVELKDNIANENKTFSDKQVQVDKMCHDKDTVKVVMKRNRNKSRSIDLDNSKENLSLSVNEDSFLKMEEELSMKYTPRLRRSQISSDLTMQDKDSKTKTPSKALKEYMHMKSCSSMLETPDTQKFKPFQDRRIANSGNMYKTLLSKRVFAELQNLYDDGES